MTDQTTFQKGESGLQKPEKSKKPISEIENPEERKLERLKRNYQPLTQ